MSTVRQRHRRTDGRTDGRTTYNSNTALAVRASRGKIVDQWRDHKFAIILFLPTCHAQLTESESESESESKTTQQSVRDGPLHPPVHCGWQLKLLTGHKHSRTIRSAKHIYSNIQTGPKVHNGKPTNLHRNIWESSTTAEKSRYVKCVITTIRTRDGPP